MYFYASHPPLAGFCVRRSGLRGKDKDYCCVQNLFLHKNVFTHSNKQQNLGTFQLGCSKSKRG